MHAATELIILRLLRESFKGGDVAMTKHDLLLGGLSTEWHDDLAILLSKILSAANQQRGIFERLVVFSEYREVLPGWTCLNQVSQATLRISARLLCPEPMKSTI